MKELPVDKDEKQKGKGEGSLKGRGYYGEY